MDADLADMDKLLNQAEPATGSTPPAKIDPKVTEQAMRAVLGKPKRDEHPPLTGLHAPPASFKRGQSLSIIANVPPTRKLAAIAGVRLRYRRVNQAEIWQMIEMERSGPEYRAVIAAEYTDSPFPLQYHFQIRTPADAWLLPGLEHPVQGQPYYVVRQG